MIIKVAYRLGMLRFFLFVVKEILRESLVFALLNRIVLLVELTQLE